MRPSKHRKRLVPHLFTWTHNSVGILLILHITKYSGTLRRACEGHVSDEDLNMAVSLLLDWLKDMRLVDATAQWACEFLLPIFGFRDVAGTGRAENVDQE